MKRFRRDYLFAVAMCAFILFSFTSSAAAGTIYVKWDSPGPEVDGTSWDTAYHSVQQGLDAAVSGDEVWVAAGTYVECITLKDGVALLGGFAGVGDARDIETYETVLDGNQAGSVVTSPPGATPSTRIDGFVICNGRASYGSAIRCWQGSPTIANNRVVRNTAYLWTGVIDCHEASPAIVNNLFTRNEGPSIWCAVGSYPKIINNAIVGNKGSGIECSPGSSPNIVNNTIAGNADWMIGYIRYYGRGIFFADVSPTVTNNIVVFNSGGIGAWYAPGNPILTNNCVYGNSRYDYLRVLPGTGDISLDPLFRNMPSGDFHLRWDSPCIDAGTDEDAPSTDMDGNPRPVDGDWDGLAVTDIGAYEYAPIQVTIDVLPGNSGNVINPQPNRMITVAVLSDPGFDARNIDPSSVRFGPGQAAEAHNRGHWEDVNGDGLTDLLLHFRCGEIRLRRADTSVTLLGRLNDGERIVGSDTITVRPR